MREIGKGGVGWEEGSPGWETGALKAWEFEREERIWKGGQLQGGFPLVDRTSLFSEVFW